ncbi:hypothetical protein VTJ83DRAFT_6109 [Remersonia thermophila]|uniref:Uncharacterized protein n=1 Tax=Remersonia thermophila TaxID=72144 RepID=A0ABR4D915_9PEZI
MTIPNPTVQAREAQAKRPDFLEKTDSPDDAKQLVPYQPAIGTEPLDDRPSAGKAAHGDALGSQCQTPTTVVFARQKEGIQMETNSGRVEADFTAVKTDPCHPADQAVSQVPGYLAQRAPGTYFEGQDRGLQVLANQDVIKVKFGQGQNRPAENAPQATHESERGPTPPATPPPQTFSPPPTTSSPQPSSQSRLVYFGHQRHGMQLITNSGELNLSF